MKRRNAVEYANDYPKLRKWIRECPICHATGYDPEMPDNIGGFEDGFPANYFKRYLTPLEVDEMGFCRICSKLINN